MDKAKAQHIIGICEDLIKDNHRIIYEDEWADSEELECLLIDFSRNMTALLKLTHELLERQP